jgi:hypothetical protein
MTMRSANVRYSAVSDGDPSRALTYTLCCWAARQQLPALYLLRLLNKGPDLLEGQLGAQVAVQGWIGAHQRFD